jgi:hypothetical protein
LCALRDWSAMAPRSRASRRDHGPDQFTFPGTRRMKSRGANGNATTPTHLAHACAPAHDASADISAAALRVSRRRELRLPRDARGRGGRDVDTLARGGRADRRSVGERESFDGTRRCRARLGHAALSIDTGARARGRAGALALAQPRGGEPVAGRSRPRGAHAPHVTSGAAAMPFLHLCVAGAGAARRTHRSRRDTWRTR